MIIQIDNIKDYEKHCIENTDLYYGELSEQEEQKYIVDTYDYKKFLEKVSKSGYFVTTKIRFQEHEGYYIVIESSREDGSH